MAGIFINYRREDARADASRLFEDLRRRCKDEHVFLDLTMIGGEKYRAALLEKVKTCDVLLALIGTRWLHVTDEATGKRRLDEELDLVRLEIATALANDKRVIPVILPGAKMPSPESLPESIRELAGRHAFELDYKHWVSGVKELVQQFPDSLRGCEDNNVPDSLRGRDDNLTWWPHMLLFSISLLTATHVFAAFNISFIRVQYLNIGLSLVLGIVQASLFHSKISQHVVFGLVVSVVTGVLASIFVPILDGGQNNIIPETLEEITQLATYVAGMFAGYLMGTMVGNVIIRNKVLRH